MGGLANIYLFGRHQHVGGFKSHFEIEWRRSKKKGNVIAFSAKSDLFSKKKGSIIACHIMTELPGALRGGT